MAVPSLPKKRGRKKREQPVPIKEEVVEENVGSRSEEAKELKSGAKATQHQGGEEGRGFGGFGVLGFLELKFLFTNF